MRRTLAATVLAALAVGCGSAASAPEAEPATSLRISYWSEGKAKGDDTPEAWTLRCDPAGGSLPNDGEACRKLKVLKRPFAPARKGLMCTQVYGGPGEAVISGTFRGERVWTRLSLTDGCQISRFKRLAFLVPGFAVGGPDS
ncbi:MAG: subtilase-type protease inhibitor [Actinomycetota bacterium]|nr:subtilase-type protease inhibitor [Actinomycetota bacterium]